DGEHGREQGEGDDGHFGVLPGDGLGVGRRRACAAAVGAGVPAGHGAPSARGGAKLDGSGRLVQCRPRDRGPGRAAPGANPRAALLHRRATSGEAGMNGAESLVATARAAGIELCFANPGTTEMPLVTALDAVGGVRSVLGLFEGVCTGAADGYARMAGSPALVLLHLGPGLANGLANLHNAKRARSPVVVVVGDHASWHLAADAPLASDVAAVAAPFSRWVRRARSSRELAGDFGAALAAALGPPGGVSTLVAPADAQWEPADGPARPARSAPERGIGDRVEATAQRLRAARAPALFLGGDALAGAGLRAAARV